MRIVQRWAVLVLLNTFLCISYAASNEWHALVLSDTHLNPSATSQTSYYDSDTGQTDLWPSAQTELAQLVQDKKPRFVMLLGDLPAHHMSAADMKLADQQVFSMMNTVVASAGVPWFFVPGNNDSLEDDYVSFTKRDSDTGAKTNLISEVGNGLPGQGFASSCDGAVGPCVIDKGTVADTDYFFGTYSAYPSSDRHLRLVVLNTVLWLQERYVSDDGVPQDKAGQWQLSWLKEQLSDASKAGEKVIIAMHIPSGVDSYKGMPYWKGSFQKTWQAIIATYGDCIALVMNGHTHMNALRVLGSTEGHVYSLTVPGVTPLHGNNPGMDDLVWGTAEKGLPVWTDVNVYAYSPENQKWSLYENFRKVYAPDCASLSMITCLLAIKKETLFSVLDRYYYLRPEISNEPSEGWDAVNEAAWG